MDKVESEPVIVLVLYILAFLAVVAGIILGAATGGPTGAFYGLTIGLGGSLSWWALGTIIRLLHRIAENTTPEKQAPPPKAQPSPATRPHKQEASDTYKL